MAAATRDRGGRSVSVGTAAGQYAEDVDHAGLVAIEADAPVADPQAPLILDSGEPDHVTDRRVADEAVERLDDPGLDRRVEPAEVASGREA